MSRRRFPEQTVGVMPLAWIPNRVGYHFVGVKKCGTECECFVEQGPDGLHRVAGAATLEDLKAWRMR